MGTDDGGDRGYGHVYARHHDRANDHDCDRVCVAVSTVDHAFCKILHLGKMHRNRHCMDNSPIRRQCLPRDDGGSLARDQPDLQSQAPDRDIYTSDNSSPPCLRRSRSHGLGMFEAQVGGR